MSNSGIHIKPSHRGRLTAKAKAAGKSLSAYESNPGPHPSESTKRQIIFAENAKKWNH
jgi:hypothetical protein